MVNHGSNVPTKRHTVKESINNDNPKKESNTHCNGEKEANLNDGGLKKDFEILNIHQPSAAIVRGKGEGLQGREQENCKDGADADSKVVNYFNNEMDANDPSKSDAIKEKMDHNVGSPRPEISSDPQMWRLVDDAIFIKVERISIIVQLHTQTYDAQYFCIITCNNIHH